jgi:hypothetical protein
MKCKNWQNLHFENFIFIQQWLTQNMWYIGATICIFNKKLQNISLVNLLMWKNEKDWERTYVPL